MQRSVYKKAEAVDDRLCYLQLSYFKDSSTATATETVMPTMGERQERCLWQIKRLERVAAVDKIEEKRKPEDFIGHRNREERSDSNLQAA